MNKSFRFFIVLLMPFCLFSGVTSTSAQKLHTRKLGDTRFTEHFQVSEGNSDVLDGKYELYYKSHLIERGRYKNGVRAGVWNFYNLNNLFEFQYDFTRDLLLNLSGSDIYARNNYTPPLFLGSPLIPYIYILDSLGYPLETFEKNVEGKVVLTLIISTEGEILESFISESLDEATDREVLNTVKNFPDTWRWIPAKRDGIKIESDYKITVYFDLD